jgi:hypothetical protein
MWKYFVPNRDKHEDLVWLREQFPGHFYFNGSHKDARGVFACRDATVREYGEKVEATHPEATHFWHPKSQIDIQNFQKHPELPSIWVELMCGERLRIVPASAIPRQIFFGRDNTSLYNTKLRYGKLAFEFTQKAANKEPITLGEDLTVSLIEESLMYSYALPIELWNSLGLISHSDLDPLLAAACGFNFETLKKAASDC